MTLKRFLYFLLKPDGRSGKVVNGTVTFSGTPTPLPQTPQGWEDILIGWERSVNLHGIIRSFTLPLGFVLDGAKIIRDAVYKQSIEEPLQLLILRLVLQYSPTSFNWFYEYFYRGEIDLSETDHALDMVQVQVMEGGISKLLKANMNTVYEFAFDNDAVTLEMDGIDLTGQAKYAVIDGVEISNALYSTFFLPFSMLNVEGLAPGMAWVSQQLQDTTGQPLATRLASTNYFAVNTSTTDTLSIRLRGKVIITCTAQNGGNGIQLRFYNSNQNVGNQALYTAVTIFVPVAGQTYTKDIDVTIPVAPGERLYFEGFIGTTGVPTKFVFQPGSEISAEFVNRFATTYVPAFTRDVLYRKLVGKVLGDEALASSALCLTNQNLCVTSFDAVRGFPNAVLKASLQDFFADTDCTLCAGMGIENGLLVLEARTHFYDPSNPIALGNAKTVKHKPSKELLTTVFKFGHVKPNVEDVNGKYDPNGSITWTGPLTRAEGKVYDMVSPWKAGPYEIELTRVNLDGKSTTDTSNENDVCVINANGSKVFNETATFDNATQSITFPSNVKIRAGQRFRIQGSALGNDAVYTVVSGGSIITNQVAYVGVALVNETAAVTITFLTGAIYSLVRVTYDTLEGVPTDTIFNIEQLTPMRMMMAHWEWIRSMHHGLDHLKLTFSSGDKNYDLRTVLAGVEIKEKSDVPISSMGTIRWKPWFDTFQTEVPVNLAALLEASPNRCFSYVDEEGLLWTGFLFGSGIAPNTLQEQEFKLLMAPANDVTLLV